MLPPRTIRRSSIPSAAFLFLTIAVTPSAHAATDLSGAAAELARAARTKSFDIRAAEAEATQRGAQTWTSIARWLPRVDLSISQSRSLDNSILSSGMFGSSSGLFEPEEVQLARWSLTATAPLYRRSIHLGVRQALAEREQAVIRRDTLLTQLDLNVRTQLAQLMVSEFEVMSTDAAIESAQRSLAEAELRFRLGQKTKVDVIRAQANLTSLKSQRISAVDARQVARDKFLESTGLSESELIGTGLYRRDKADQPLVLARDIAALEGELARFTEVQPKLVAALQEFGPSSVEGDAFESKLEHRLIDRSLSYAGLAAGERLARAGADALVAAEWPELAVQGSVNEQAETWSGAVDPAYRSYSVAVTVSIPVFSWGTLVSTNIEGSRAAEAAGVRRERDAIGLLDRTRSDLIRLEGLRTSLEARKLAVEQNQELVRLTFTSYQLGRSSILELLAAETEYSRARSELARGRTDLASLAWRLGWELGYDLDGEEHEND